MAHTQQPSASGVHHRRVTDGELESFIDEIKTTLLGVRAGIIGHRDRRSSEYHKDLQQNRKKIAEVVGVLTAKAFNDGSPFHQVTRLAQVITTFFNAHIVRATKPYSEVSALETRNEGEMNCAQNRVDLGDHSRPALLALKAEIADSRAILDELDASIDAELYPDGEKLRTVCSWCTNLISEGSDPTSDKVSHGCCDRCAAIHFPERKAS